MRIHTNVIVISGPTASPFMIMMWIMANA